MLLGNTQQLVAQALNDHSKRLMLQYILVDHMTSGDQLLTDNKLIRQLAKAVGVSDKKIDQLSSRDVSD